jgi:hypothetical protein
VDPFIARHIGLKTSFPVQYPTEAKLSTPLRKFQIPPQSSLGKVHGGGRRPGPAAQIYFFWRERADVKICPGKLLEGILLPFNFRHVNGTSYDLRVFGLHGILDYTGRPDALVLGNTNRTSLTSAFIFSWISGDFLVPGKGINYTYWVASTIIEWQSSEFGENLKMCLTPWMIVLH